MKSVFIKKVKRHEEIWAYIPDWDEGKVKFSRGHLYPGRPFLSFDYGSTQVWLPDRMIEEVQKLCKEQWKKSDLKLKEER